MLNISCILSAQIKQMHDLQGGKFPQGRKASTLTFSPKIRLLLKLSKHHISSTEIPSNLCPGLVKYQPTWLQNSVHPTDFLPRERASVQQSKGSLCPLSSFPHPTLVVLLMVSAGCNRVCFLHPASWPLAVSALKSLLLPGIAKTRIENILQKL